jgi:tetratricopeptide (TPR) repeat protein
MPLPDHTRNAWGEYWKTTAVYKHLSNLREVVSLSSDEDERSAALYSLAYFLYQTLSLEEAEAVCADIARSKPDGFPPTVRLLAEIYARKGDIERALTLAQQLEQHSDARAFRVSESDLREIYRESLRTAP